MGREIINRKLHVYVCKIIGRHYSMSLVHNITFLFRQLRETAKILQHREQLL